MLLYTHCCIECSNLGSLLGDHCVSLHDLVILLGQLLMELLSFNCCMLAEFFKVLLLLAKLDLQHLDVLHEDAFKLVVLNTWILVKLACRITNCKTFTLINIHMCWWKYTHQGTFTTVDSVVRLCV